MDRFVEQSKEWVIVAVTKLCLNYMCFNQYMLLYISFTPIGTTKFTRTNHT